MEDITLKGPVRIVSDLSPTVMPRSANPTAVSSLDVMVHLNSEAPLDPRSPHSLSVTPATRGSQSRVDFHEIVVHEVQRRGVRVASRFSSRRRLSADVAAVQRKPAWLLDETGYPLKPIERGAIHGPLQKIAASGVDLYIPLDCRRRPRRKISTVSDNGQVLLLLSPAVPWSSKSANQLPISVN